MCISIHTALYCILSSACNLFSIILVFAGKIEPTPLFTAVYPRKEIGYLVKTKRVKCKEMKP